MKHLVLLAYRLLTAVALPLAIPVLRVRDHLAGKSRPPWSERFLRPPPPLPKGGLWIQAVSVGEVEVARRLVTELSGLGLPIVVTATTATGLALARKTLAREAAVTPCPVDRPGPVRRFLAAAEPRALILVETELWPEMLHQAALRGLPVAVVNARLSDVSFRRYRRIRFLLKALLAPLGLVLARDAGDAERFAALGVDPGKVRVGGNVKYDLTPDDRPLPWAEALGRWAAGRPVLVAGSTMAGEEAMVLDALDRLDGERPFLILAPRHPERFDEVAADLRNRGLRLCRRSRLEDGENGPCDVFLLDTIGELARAYRHASVAFIGGSLVPTGGHNPLEAAVWGVPVLTGPHVHNFAEVYREMLAAGAADTVAGEAEFAARLGAWLGAPDTAKEAGERGLEVIRRNTGAAEKTAREVESFLGAGREERAQD